MTSLTQSAAIDAIYKRVIDNWTATAFLFDEDEKDSNGVDLAQGTDPWVRWTVRHTDSALNTFGNTGNRRYLREGILTASILTLEKNGRGAGDEYLDTARTLFEGVCVDGIDYQDATTQEVGVDGKWYIINLDIAFDYYQIK